MNEDRMNEDRIDQTLKALTHAQPPHGMEDRILRRVQTHRPQPSARPWLLPACALCACALIALAVALRPRAVSTPTPISNLGILTPPSPIAPLAPQPAAPRKPHHRLVTAPRPVAMEVSFPAPPAPLTQQEKLLVRLAHAREAEQFKAVAVQQPKAANVTLTHEEVLLVAVSRIRQDAVLDALDPVRRAEADAREKQEFKAYVQQKDGGS